MAARGKVFHRDIYILRESGFSSLLDTEKLFFVLFYLVASLLCLTVHETCHGLAAHALGDPTAKECHRLSLNPLRHIDWLGFAAMLLLGVGWAKPMPVDKRFFRHPRLGMALTALAGPASNLLLAGLLMWGVEPLYHKLEQLPHTRLWSIFGLTLISFIFVAIMINFWLGIFNLLPLFPLDGAKALLVLILPGAAYEKLMRCERYGRFVLYTIILICELTGFLIDEVYDAFSDLIF